MAPDGTACNRGDCEGTVRSNGFCDTCHRRPRPGGPPPRPAPDPKPEPPEPPGPDPDKPDPDPDHRVDDPPQPSNRGRGGELDQDGLLRLDDVAPRIDPMNPGDLPQPDPPAHGRICGHHGCTARIGVDAGPGSRPRTSGHCPACGRYYSFEPQLRRGDVVGRYRVHGPLAHGGIGWVYLAEDLDVPGHLVVLKGLIDPGADRNRPLVDRERERLTQIRHRDIVRIITYVEHRPDGAEEPTGYVVMDHIDGLPLDKAGTRVRTDVLLTYGWKILGALDHLHEKGLYYCDMKPANVVHYGREIKIIDLGAVREADDRTTPVSSTPRYSPPREEIRTRGWHRDSDLCTVGATLAELAGLLDPHGNLIRPHPDSSDVAAHSLYRLMARAMHPDPRQRFESAREMARQVWEVLREFRALAFHEQQTPSGRFRSADDALGNQLGEPPSTADWAERARLRPGSSELEPPDSRRVAWELPEPIPLVPLPDGSPEDAIDHWERRVRRDTETALWLCRVSLWRGDPRSARMWLDRAVARLGEEPAPAPDSRADPGADLVRARTGDTVVEQDADPAPSPAPAPGAGEQPGPGPDRPRSASDDWRTAWHSGLVSLYSADGGDDDRDDDGDRDGDGGTPADGPRSRIERARADFDAVYRMLPGEWAVKLALGYCAERLDGVKPESDRYYEAVHRRDRGQGTAAFALARAYARKGDRAGALKVLRRVPATSRHFEAARIAAVRIGCGSLGGRPPGAEALNEAVALLRGLPHLDPDVAVRLAAEVREAAIDAAPDGGWGDVFRDDEDGRLLARGKDEELRSLQESAYRWLADRAASAAERGAMLDRANRVRPMSWW